MELYQDEFTRKPNGLIFKMRELFDEEKLTIWEFQEFKRMVYSFSKENGLHFDQDKEMLYKKRD